MKHHPQVPHPVVLRLEADLKRYENGFRGKIAAGNDWLASHLAIIFGAVWTVWVFFIWPLVANHLGTGVQAQTSYYAQSWIQLFALPLFVYVGNKLQRSSDAQSDAMHQALTHIATIEDQNAELLRQNTELTVQIHKLVGGTNSQTGSGGVLFSQEAIMVSTVQGFDATHDNIGSLPKGQAAGYVTGSGGIMWTAGDWAAHPNAVRIDQSPVLSGTDETADVLDYENGAATISDIAPWAKAALVNYHNAVRPGQRVPAVYCSRSNLTAVANALVAGKLTGVGLWVADWTGNEAIAAAQVASGSGPYPVIGVQYENAGDYDKNVFSVPWLTTVSVHPAAPAAHADEPPGQWNDPSAWSWLECVLIGKGLDGQLHVFSFDPANGTWVKSE